MPFDAILGMGKTYPSVPYTYMNVEGKDILIQQNVSSSVNLSFSGTGAIDGAVLDSCAVFVRRELLARARGWPVGTYPNSSHCTDLWICLVAARHHYRVRIVGVDCTHASGGKGSAGTRWLDDRGGDVSLHRAAHVLIYNDFRDVLPLRA